LANARKRLLVLTSTFPRWEGDNTPPFVYDLCRRLTRNFEVWIIAPHAAGAAIREDMGEIHVVRFRYLPDCMEHLAYDGGILANLRNNPLNFLAIPFFLWALWRELQRMLRHISFDVIHAHWIIPQGWIAARRGGRNETPRLVCTVHGSDLNVLRNPIFKQIQHWVFQHADAITVVSHALAEKALALGAPPTRLAVVPMGIDVQRLFVPSSDPGNRAILFVGRLVPEKGPEVLIDAMPLVLEKHPDATLHVVGDGPLRTHLAARAHQLGIEHRITFHGAMPHAELPRFFRNASIFVLPSLNEGFGLTAAEALACNRAVIASALPALRDFIKDGETGLLFPPGNSVALAERILHLFANESLRHALASAGRAVAADRFEWNAVAKRYSAILAPETVS